VEHPNRCKSRCREELIISLPGQLRAFAPATARTCGAATD
jgi:hypothetical protein